MTPATAAPFVFLDRDGTLIEEPPDQQVDSLAKLRFLPGAIGGLRSLVRSGYQLVMVSNQDGLGGSRYPHDSFDEVQERILDTLAREDVVFHSVFICPHLPSDGCGCRKPATGLVADLLASGEVDRASSFMVGDRETDVEFAQALGVRSIRLMPDDRTATNADERAASIADACSRILASRRRSSDRRTTKETDIRVEVALDGSGRSEILTGLGFLDHMLTLLALHSSIDLVVRADGDLHVDEHHTMEDTGLVLGGSIRTALGTKSGIERYGFVLPMDEALSTVALDISGRPFLKFDVPFTRERVGDVPTELFEDFFRAFADGLRATLHIEAHGRNDHHIAEACFKGLGRCLRQAIMVRDDLRHIVPSTKGSL